MKKYIALSLVGLSCCLPTSFSQSDEPAMHNVSSSVLASGEVASPASLPEVKYHLTARPWQPLNISREAYLNSLEGAVRAIAKYQSTSGAIIDPYAKREVQYATPYFANALGTLLSLGRAKDLLNKGVAAMNKATIDISEGAASIPDNHGEFFVAPLAAAIPLYMPFVSSTQLQTWKTRMARPINEIIRGPTQNWRTYAMKGEWFRAKNGYVNKTAAVAWIEDSWIKTQKKRIVNNSWRFYHDGTSNPDAWAYDAIARSNFFAMITDGYDGASRNEMLSLIKSATQYSLLLQDASGQWTPGGRSCNHTWNDILLGNGYEMLAEHESKEGNMRLAGQYRRAAELAFQSVERWKRTNGTYSVTKNHYDPASRVGYAAYSFVTNYNGNIIFPLAENILRIKTNIAEEATPAEIGGYTIVTDTLLASAFANAGGMSMKANLRGAVSTSHGQYWTPLGVVRFARPDWDSRLGPSDGVRESPGNMGISFAPTFFENGAWVMLANVPERYEAFFSTQFTHPVLVRCRLEYKPRSGKTGPSFTNDFVITPDGILSTLVSTTSTFGVTWPILTFDGATKMSTYITAKGAGVSFPGSRDEQNFMALHTSPKIVSAGSTRRSSYGDLIPVRMESDSSANITFIYPRNAADPSADLVQKSFSVSGGDYSSSIGRVTGTIYVGRTSAGGVGDTIDLDNDSKADAIFSLATGFIMQLKDGEITSIETDRDVSAVIYGDTFSIHAYTPIEIHKVMLNSQVIASTDDGNLPVNTIDGRLETRWSAYGNNQWIRYQLQSEAEISLVKIAWYRGDTRQATFDIQTSNDAASWTTVFSGRSSGNTTLPEKYVLPTATTARYVRILGHGNTLNLWNAITEVQIIKQVDLGKSTVTASTDDGNIAANTLDKNLSTRWSAYANSQWIRYKFEKETIMKTVKIAWYRGNERKASFDIQTSLDGHTWNTVYSGLSSGTTLLHEAYDVALMPATFIQILCKGNSLDLWNAITEVEFVLNAPSSLQTALVAERSDKTFPVSEEAPGSDNIKVWPNPGTGTFNIEINNNWLDAELKIYDGEGRMIYMKSMTTLSDQLHLPPDSKGIHHLLLSKKDKVIRKKILVR